jgi:hypothetical protein
MFWRPFCWFTYLSFANICRFGHTLFQRAREEIGKGGAEGTSESLFSSHSGKRKYCMKRREEDAREQKNSGGNVHTAPAIHSPLPAAHREVGKQLPLSYIYRLFPDTIGVLLSETQNILISMGPLGPFTAPAPPSLCVGAARSKRAREKQQKQ